MTLTHRREGVVLKSGRRGCNDGEEKAAVGNGFGCITLGNGKSKAASTKRKGGCQCKDCGAGKRYIP